MSSNDATVQTILESEDLKLSTTEMYGAGHEDDPPHRKRAPLLEHKSAQGKDALFLLVVVGSRLGDDRKILNKKNTPLHDSKNIHAPETTANKKTRPRDSKHKKNALLNVSGARLLFGCRCGDQFVVLLSPGSFFVGRCGGVFFAVVPRRRSLTHWLPGFVHRQQNTTTAKNTGSVSTVDCCT